MSVHKKILAVMQDVEYLRKDDEVSFGNTRYKGLTEEKVTAAVRASLVKNGLIVFPIAQVHHREPIGEKTAMLTTVDVTYRFVDTEDDSFIEVVSSGTGVDTQDKGVGKAMTYCYKYLFLRTFAIPTGDDPDKISSAELDDKQKVAAKKNPPKAPPKNKVAPPSQTNPDTDIAPDLLTMDVPQLLNLRVDGKPIFSLDENRGNSMKYNEIKDAGGGKDFLEGLRKVATERRAALAEGGSNYHGADIGDYDPEKM